jgi:hypothetical protein
MKRTLSTLRFGSAIFQSIKCRAVPLLCVIVLVLPESLSAEGTAGQTPQKSFFDFLNPTHDYWSEKLVGYAGRFDHFFGDIRAFEEANESVVQFDLNEVVKEGGSYDTTLKGRARMSLPLAKKRVHLLLESDPEKLVTGEATGVGPVLPGDIAAPNSYAAAVRYQKAVKNIWGFSTDAGVKLRSGLEPFVRARGSVAIPMGKRRLKLTETLFWFKTIGAGETTRVDFEHIFNELVLFRSASTGTWLNDEHSFNLRQDLSVYHAVDDRTAMLYQLSAVGTSHPQAQVDEYVALVRYRYRLHRDWLFAEVSPQMHYPVEQDYHPEPQLVLLLELLFGGAVWTGEH